MNAVSWQIIMLCIFWTELKKESVFLIYYLTPFFLIVFKCGSWIQTPHDIPIILKKIQIQVSAFLNPSNIKYIFSSLSQLMCFHSYNYHLFYFFPIIIFPYVSDTIVRFIILMRNSYFRTDNSSLPDLKKYVAFIYR